MYTQVLLCTVLTMYSDSTCSEDNLLGFPGGAGARNLPANEGDTGSSPGPGRSHRLRNNWAGAPQLLSPCAIITEAHVPRARAPQQEKP